MDTRNLMPRDISVTAAELNPGGDDAITLWSAKRKSGRRFSEKIVRWHPRISLCRLSLAHPSSRVKKWRTPATPALLTHPSTSSHGNAPPPRGADKLRHGAAAGPHLATHLSQGHQSHPFHTSPQALDRVGEATLYPRALGERAGFERWPPCGGGV